MNSFCDGTPFTAKQNVEVKRKHHHGHTYHRKVFQIFRCEHGLELGRSFQLSQSAREIHDSAANTSARQPGLQPPSVANTKAPNEEVNDAFVGPRLRVQLHTSTTKHEQLGLLDKAGCTLDTATSSVF